MKKKSVLAVIAAAIITGGRMAPAAISAGKNTPKGTGIPRTGHMQALRAP